MPRSPSVLVIGAGFGGLGVGIELLRAGFGDVTILEQADEIGGVWRDNTYPNAACDVPSSLYSWSFAPNPGWGHRYSRQDEILDYLHRTAAEQGVLDHVRTGVRVTGAAWHEDEHRWHVRTASGESLTADVLVPALGQLSRPVVPDLPGIDRFAGPAFHSAQWRHDVDLTGARVAVVGTGASAIQFVPGIVDRVASMTVFQRSAPYVVPKPDRAYTRTHHRAFSGFPPSQTFGRRLTWVLSERLNAALTAGGAMKRLLELGWRAQLRRQVPDAALRGRLRPDYPLGCKRLLFSNDWYPALAQDHVEVVTEVVTEVEPAGVRATDGRLHEADVIIWGTGFAATEFLAPLTITGSGGVDLHEVWADGAHAHLGMTVPGFPNLFLVYGPNTNLGGSSIIGMMEAQAGYIRQAVRAVARGRTLAVRRSVAASFDAEMQERLAHSVWAQCNSWYRADGGRVSTNWPGMVAEYVARTARLEASDFEPAGVRDDDVEVLG
ncbi:NAD(P)/FAD-dependent oxidoreductase [Nocardioides sp. MJB4]|uniref:NAD(P)/FAD-dependent oxidoreductase n=1 Tax=Nocardioides donggukensis TaxID=2774019 RepID=A0A927K9D2_9ACTN|nr:NAD(P)/FAD-dependent oxidoreductase [Nocardioides donggukensis]